MQNSGQTTLDFLFIFLGLLMVLESLNYIQGEFAVTQAYRGSSFQANGTSENIAKLASAMAVFNQATATSGITYTIPEIKVPGSIDATGCTVKINGTAIETTVILDSSPAADNPKRSAQLVNPANATFSPVLSGSGAECGEKLAITKP